MQHMYAVKELEDKMKRTTKNAAKTFHIHNGNVLPSKIKKNNQEWNIQPGGQESKKLPHAIVQKHQNQHSCNGLNRQTQNHAQLDPSKLPRQTLNISKGRPLNINIYLGKKKAGDSEWFK